MNGLSLIIPCYNEEDAIGPTLRACETALAAIGLPYEIIVVDDGSTDATAMRVDPERYRLIHNDTNLGYGASIKRAARAARYDRLVIVDADGTYPIDRLADLVERADDAEMVVGARVGADVQIPLMRRPAKWVLARLAAWLTGRRIPDLNSGFRVIDRTFFHRFEPFYSDGFSLTTTITLAALTNNCRIIYVPIAYHARVGRSKIRPIRDTLGFLQLIVRTVLYFNPLKIFLPVSLGLLLLSVLVAVVSKLAGQLMDVSTVILFVAGLQLLMLGMLADLITRRIR